MPCPRSSSGSEAASSGFLSNADMDLGVAMEFPQGSQAMSRVETCKSTFLTSYNIGIRIPVKFIYGPVSFCRGATWLSHVPPCCESILGVTFKSVQGNQMYLQLTGTSRSFGMVARPLEFLSTFILRAPLLEVRRERRDSFPDEAGKGTLISR